MCPLPALLSSSGLGISVTLASQKELGSFLSFQCSRITSTGTIWSLEVWQNSVKPSIPDTFLQSSSSIMLSISPMEIGLFKLLSSYLVLVICISLGNCPVHLDFPMYLYPPIYLFSISYKSVGNCQLQHFLIAALKSLLDNSYTCIILILKSVDHLLSCELRFSWCWYSDQFCIVT